MRPDMEVVIKRANLINGDLLARFFLVARFACITFFFVQRIGLQQTEIRMIALGQPDAGGANSTGLRIGSRSFAEQRLGKTSGEVKFADSPLTRNQQGHAAVASASYAAAPKPRCEVLLFS